LTDLPQHVEVFGGNAELFRPGDVKALAAILQRLPARDSRPTHAPDPSWTWADVGLAMRQIYRQVCPDVVPSA
jgi:hypothetical protein